MLRSSDQLYATNNTDETIIIGWGNVEYPLKPHLKTIVPFDAVANAFGDPRAVADMQHIEEANGVHSWIPDRPSEVRRLRLRYARFNTFGDETNLFGPDVDIHTLDGAEVHTVLKDPDGVLVDSTLISRTREISVDDAIAELREKLDALMAQQNAGEDINVTPESAIPVDEGNSMMARPRRKVTPKAEISDDSFPSTGTDE